MGRRRSQIIEESLPELRELYDYYSESPQAERIAFLASLKEDKRQTIEKAAADVGISMRRGERLWTTYRRNGLRGVLDRRDWNPSKTQSTSEDSVPSQNDQFSNSSAFDLVSFLTRISLIADAPTAEDWTMRFRGLMQAWIKEADHVIVNIRYGGRGPKYDPEECISHRQNINEDGNVWQSVTHTGDYTEHSDRIVSEGNKSGFPFEDYHSPPMAFDLFEKSGMRTRGSAEGPDTYLGTILLLRRRHKPDFDKSTVNMIERLRPFLSFLFSGQIARWSSREAHIASVMELVRERVEWGDLSRREREVFSLILHGNTQGDIAEILNLSISTVQSHTRSIYRKIGIARISDLLALLFSGPSGLKKGRVAESTEA